jgi:predicted glycosyltransferase
MNEKPKILFYCQHSLGMGHLVRSLALAESLSADFRVILLNGGRLPKKMRVPPEVKIINLPPLGLDENNKLVSRDRRRTVEKAQTLRKKIILDAYRMEKAEILLIELFPFGRKKFSGELVPLLEKARGKSKIVCSLRDILVGQRSDRKKFEERAVETANRFFDAILVHSDSDFARLEDSFQMTAALRVPVFYTGFVAPENNLSNEAKRISKTRKIIVSAGGGLVGKNLLQAAIEAHALLPDKDEIEMKIIGGLFLPENDWNSLRETAKNQKNIYLRRFVKNLSGEMRRAELSISQCGYNTTLDILRSGVPALVVPFGEAGGEDEQTKRARSLEKLGAWRVFGEKLTAKNLAREIQKTLQFQPRKISLDINGGEKSALILKDLLSKKSPRIHFKNSWLAPVYRALEERRETVKVFFRDDDAGIENARLFKLLDLFEKFALPLDIAVIPKEISSALANELSLRLKSKPNLLAIHQHGFAHVSHETEGRKCEFGKARTKAQQFFDIATGQRILAQNFGALPQPIFTPPWNRCTIEAGEILRELDFKVLSREAEAEPLSIKGLTEIPVSVDWFAKRKGIPLDRAEIGEMIAGKIRENETVGIMFHHALMDKTERNFLREMLTVFSSSPQVESSLMWTLYEFSRKKELTKTVG